MSRFPLNGVSFVPELLAKTGRAMVWGAALLLGSSAYAAEPPWTEPLTGLRFLPIPKGCFRMGTDAPGKKPVFQRQLPPRDDERPRHKVCVDAFWLADTETTEAAWQRLQGNPSAVSDSALPQVGVTWEALDAALRHFNNSTSAGVRFRLPTEAEWEYACRAGSPLPVFKEGDSAQVTALATMAWIKEFDPQGGAAHPVGQKQGNAWGLFDMLGNVWEMTEDGYRIDGYRHHSLYNPRIKRDSEKIVIRGGSYRSFRDQAHCTGRNYGLTDDVMPTVGFRLVAERVQHSGTQVTP